MGFIFIPLFFLILLPQLFDPPSVNYQLDTQLLKTRLGRLFTKKGFLGIGYKNKLIFRIKFEVFLFFILFYKGFQA